MLTAIMLLCKFDVNESIPTWREALSDPSREGQLLRQAVCGGAMPKLSNEKDAECTVRTR